MELVYLWVEEYKNIYRQGFNFSPRFDCTFHDEYEKYTDEDGEEKERLKDNCKLDICDKKKKECDDNDYIENFFGDNINVTAIVGKNGSGKSSVLELVIEYNNSKFFEDKTFFVIYYKDDKLYGLYSKQCPKQMTSSFFVNFYSHEENTFNNSDSNWLISTYNVAPKKLKREDIGYKRLNGSFVNNMSVITSSAYSLSDNQFFIHKYISLFKENIKIIKKLTHVSTFDILRIKLKHRSVQIFKSYHPRTRDTKNILEITKGVISRFSREQSKYDNSMKFCNNYPRMLAPTIFIAIVDYFFSVRGINSNIFTILSDELNELQQKIKANNNECIIHIEIYTFISNIKSKIEKERKETKEIFSAIYFLIELENIKLDSNNDIFYYDFDLSSIDNDTLNRINVLAKMFDDEDKQLEDEDSLRIVELDLINSETQAEYKTISDGEKQFLKITVDFFTQLPYVANMTRNKSHIFLADEIDESLHPLWKKNLIFHLLDILKIYINDNENIFLHIIFTTHSPFLLSDIPKQNIIFLDKDSEGKCKVVDGLKEKKQTFGANIHTLLSDSFFMEDGLMGEFAKGKINEIIDFHKIVEKKRHQVCLTKIYESKKTKFWHTQSIIGEEYLKQVIKNHLVEIEKILLGKDAAKEAEIAKTKEYLKSLENDKS